MYAPYSKPLTPVGSIVGRFINVFWLFWFLCGNEVYTDSFFRKIALKVLSDKHFRTP
jgi:hypothetical protein